MTSFLNQGGYAYYVWGAYSMTFALLAGEVITLMLNHRTLLTRLGRWIRGQEQGQDERGERIDSTE